MSDFGAQQKPPVRREFRLTGAMVLGCLLGFFVIVASVNAVMMTIAIKTMPGLDVKSAYEASQTYNAEIARAHEQDARGWSADVTLGKPGADRNIVVKLTDRSGAPVRGLALQAQLAHPADRKADIFAKVREVAPGVYSANIAAAHAGAWDLVLEGRDADHEVYKSRSRIRL